MFELNCKYLRLEDITLLYNRDKNELSDMKKSGLQENNNHNKITTAAG